MNRWLWILPLAGGCIVVERTVKETVYTTDETVSGGDDDDIGDDDDDDDTTPPTDTAPPPPPDDDGDGFSVDEDCDDLNGAVNPDALETCDGIDNNCDSAIDDAAVATITAVNFETLDAAFAAAVDGDTIDVCPGVHTVASVARSSGALTVRGVAGSAATTLQEVKGLTAFALTDTAALTLDGIGLSGSTGAAITVDDQASLTVLASALTGNGQGISANGIGAGVTLTIDGAEFAGNTGGDAGGAILATNAFALAVSNSTFSGNMATFGGAIYVETVFSPASFTLAGSTFDGNSALDGGAIWTANLDIVGDGATTLSNNVATGAGGGIATYRSLVSGLVLTANDAPSGGGVAALFDPVFDAAPKENVFTNVVFDANTATLGAAVWVDDLEPFTLDTCVVTSNAAVDGGGGAYLAGVDASLNANATDFGAVGLTENLPDAVSLAGSPYVYYGVSTFACSAGACL